MSASSANLTQLTQGQILQIRQKKTEEFHRLMKGINANRGTNNCGHVALCLDDFLREGRQEELIPVPIADAGLFTQPQYSSSDNSIVRSTTQDPRLVQRVQKSRTTWSCDLTKDEGEAFIIFTPANKKEEQEKVKLFRANPTDIIEKLIHLPRRKKDDSAYGFIIYTARTTGQGHICNFFVDTHNQVYFLDAQSQKPNEWVSGEPATKKYDYIEDIFFVNSTPPEGFKLISLVKKENINPSSIPSPSSSSSSSAKAASDSHFFNNPNPKALELVFKRFVEQPTFVASSSSGSSLSANPGSSSSSSSNSSSSFNSNISAVTFDLVIPKFIHKKSVGEPDRKHFNLKNKIQTFSNHDFRHLVQRLESAGKSGNPETIEMGAYYVLGSLYREGRLIPKDIRQAVHYFKQALKLQHTLSEEERKNILPCFYLDFSELYLNKDYHSDETQDEKNKLAFHYCKLSVVPEFCRAMTTLGILYMRNIGVPEKEQSQRATLAFDYLKQGAACAENRSAIFQLGICYAQNFGVPIAEQTTRIQRAIDCFTFLKATQPKGFSSSLYFEIDKWIRSLKKDRSDAIQVCQQSVKTLEDHAKKIENQYLKLKEQIDAQYQQQLQKLEQEVAKARLEARVTLTTVHAQNTLLNHQWVALMKLESIASLPGPSTVPLTFSQAPQSAASSNPLTAASVVTPPAMQSSTSSTQTLISTDKSPKSPSK